MQKIMFIDFEDEESFEVVEDLEQPMNSMSSEPTTTGTESSTSCFTASERTRSQKATTSKRSPSPMDIDNTEEDMQGVEQRRPSLTRGPRGQYRAHARLAGISPGVVTTSAKPPPTSSFRPASGIAVPAKRPTDMREARGPTSPPPSPSAVAQPAKRRHGEASAPRRDQPEDWRFGTELDPFIIAHDPVAQDILDKNQLAWGTVYEIARGITKCRWKWSEVTKDKVRRLRGINARTAYQVTAVMQGREAPLVTEAEVWAEYDREQEAIKENRGRGLGGMGLWKGKDDWYGGRIQQVGRFVVLQGGQFSIELEKPEIRRSHRFSRFLGSRRILQIRVADDILYQHGDELRALLNSRRFVLCGRVFLPFHAKEGSMYLMETHQNYERVSSREDGDHLRMSLNQFVNWHNPLGLNSNQPISKWSTRWALGLSTSVPTIEIAPQHMEMIDDMNVSPKDWEGKAPAEKVLTDGCGFINGAALTQIMRMMKYSSRPTAVQGRIAGSKGMWVLHPDPKEQKADGPAKIWIRPSQRKIQLGPLDRAHRIFDLLAPSRVTQPSRLSSQTLVNLSYNGISQEILKDLMALGLNEEIQPFMDWTQPQSMILVWKAVERAGSVVVSRLRRLLAGQARALGLGQLRPSDDQVQEEDEEYVEVVQPLTDIGHKKSSGQPITLHESVLELLQSGFHPLQLQFLFEKLEAVITMVLDDYVKKFHIPIQESCEAYVIPDPYDVLEEGQIHFRSSDPITNPFTGEQTDIILGDVLVSRNPTRLPSDIQKVKAVAHPKLSNYVNVIVFPTKGKYSLASYLGGGDYDGDVVVLNWHKPLVEQFRGSPLCTSPPTITACFEREVVHVKDFDLKISDLQLKEAQTAFQNVLLLGLAETRVGLYSKFHDAAVYKKGYGSSEAIHLAYMFTTCLDASKTGLRVKQPIFTQDRHHWGFEKPWYVWQLEEGNNSKGQRIPSCVIQRNPESSPFILDILVEEGKRLKKEFLDSYGKLKACPKVDEDLIQPWKAALAKATLAKTQGIPGFAENLKDIRVHVEKAQHRYRLAMQGSSQRSPVASSSRNNLFDEAAALFAGPPLFSGFVFFSDEDVRRLKASFAATQSLSFAFRVAFHELCAIKAQATGNIAITQYFAQCITIPNIVARMLSQGHADT